MAGSDEAAHDAPLHRTSREELSPSHGRPEELYWAVQLESGHVLPPSVPFDRVDPRLAASGSRLTQAPFPPPAKDIDRFMKPPPPATDCGSDQILAQPGAHTSMWAPPRSACGNGTRTAPPALRETADCDRGAVDRTPPRKHGPAPPDTSPPRASDGPVLQAFKADKAWWRFIQQGIAICKYEQALAGEPVDDASYFQDLDAAHARPESDWNESSTQDLTRPDLRNPFASDSLEGLSLHSAPPSAAAWASAQCQCKCAVDANGEPTGEKCGRRPRNRHWCEACRNMVGTGCCWVAPRQRCHRCTGNPQEQETQTGRLQHGNPDRPTEPAHTPRYCAAFNGAPSAALRSETGRGRARWNQVSSTCEAPCGSCAAVASETPHTHLPRCHRPRHRRHHSHVCQQCAG